jgi:hypothetical protein
LLAGLTERAHRRQPRTHQITDRFMSLIWNPYRGQFTSAVQIGQVDRIPPVGLDPIARFARDERRDDNNTSMSSLGQLALDTVAARSSFVTEP